MVTMERGDTNGFVAIMKSRPSDEEHVTEEDTTQTKTKLSYIKKHSKWILVGIFFVILLVVIICLAFKSKDFRHGLELPYFTLF